MKQGIGNSCGTSHEVARHLNPTLIISDELCCFDSCVLVVVFLCVDSVSCFLSAFIAVAAFNNVGLLVTFVSACFLCWFQFAIVWGPVCIILIVD